MESYPCLVAEAGRDANREAITNIKLEHKMHPFLIFEFVDRADCYMQIFAKFEMPDIKTPWKPWLGLDEYRLSLDDFNRMYDEYDAKMRDAFESVTVSGYCVERMSHDITDICNFDTAPTVYSLEELLDVIDRVRSFFENELPYYEERNALEIARK